MSDATFGTWSAVASPLTIEYSLVVIEEIRQEVAEGFQKLSRGGIEVGGLLYGVKEEQTVRIMAIRPMSCEHASGPTFRLSERDRAALHEQIRHDAADSRLEDLVCVGWYVSHTRTEITLAESDQEIFSTFFAQPWQVTLVVRPSRGGNMRAGFFVREPAGTLNSSQSYLEFNFPDRMAGVFENRGENRGERRPEPRGDRPRPTAVRPPPEPRSAPIAEVPLPMPTPEVRSVVQASPVRPPSNPTSLFGQPMQAPSAIPSAFDLIEPDPDSSPVKRTSGKKWLWLVAALIVIGLLAATGARFLTSDAANETISLSVLEREGQLDIEWNRLAAPISKAVGGALEIADGPQNRSIPLKPAELALGKFSYKRDTGDIQVRMIVDEPGGKKVQEASRFLGPPPSSGNAEQLKTLQQRKDELETEVNRLKQSNDDQAQRIQQLERTLKILQTRQGN